MAGNNPNALVIEVVGDTSRLSADLSKAERELKTFSRRASTWDTRRVETGRAGDLLSDVRQKQQEAAKLEERLAGIGTTGEAAGLGAARGLGLIGAAAATAYQATQLIADGLEVTGKNATTTQGQLRNFTAELLRVNPLAALLAFNVRDQADSWEEAKQRLDDYTDSNRSWSSQLTRSTHGLRDFLDKTAQLVGFDPKLQALTDDFNKLWEAAHPPTTIDFSAIVEGFGTTPLDHLVGKDTAAAKRKGVSQTQRNQFFDARIARELDRVQDLKGVQAQVAALRGIAAELQKRIDAQKDVTRKLNLSDQLAAVNRRAQALLDKQATDDARAAEDAAAAATKAAEDAAEALRKQQAAELKLRQARQFRAIGLGPTGGEIVPGVPNLKKQLDQLTARNDIGDLSPKLRAALNGARRVLNKGWGAVTEDSRSAIQELFATIREELNKGLQSTGGPLTKTTQLSENIMAGLGLSGDQERLLRARLSHFNSAGVALTGAGTTAGITVPVTVNMDGRVVATTSAKYNRRGRKVNPSQRNGPNAGLVIS